MVILRPKQRIERRLPQFGEWPFKRLAHRARRRSCRARESTSSASECVHCNAHAQRPSECKTEQYSTRTRMSNTQLVGPLFFPIRPNWIPQLQPFKLYLLFWFSNSPLEGEQSFWYNPPMNIQAKNSLFCDRGPRSH